MTTSSPETATSESIRIAFLTTKGNGDSHVARLVEWTDACVALFGNSRVQFVSGCKRGLASGGEEPMVMKFSHFVFSLDFTGV